MPSFFFASDLPVPSDAILATLTMRGVNAELSPLVRMTAAHAYAAQSILEWPTRQKLFDSWILLFGFLPIDRHSFYFDAINSSEGFSEQSSSWMNKYWNHARKVTSQGTGCRVTDTVSYKSRIPLMDILLKPTYQLVFWVRHKNLRRRYAGRAS